MIQSIYVGLGSNLGDRAGFLLMAVRGLLDTGLQVIRLSSIYETRPVGFVDQPDFLNQVAEIKAPTVFSPEQVMARLLRIEYSLGRTRDVTMGPRTIDLDLLLYQSETRHTEFLTLPHPRMHLRRFVLAPLTELAPHLIHPTVGETFSDLLKQLNDASSVKRWSSENKTSL